MSLNKIAGRLAVAAALLGASAAFAQAGPTNAEYYPLAHIVSMKMMDKNKDGMVSRQEFLDMMAMAWDMNARKMGVKGDMTGAQFQEILMYLKAGG